MLFSKQQVPFLLFCFSLLGVVFSQTENVGSQFGIFDVCNKESLRLGEVDGTTLSMEIVDDRQLVSQTTCYPYSTVVQILSEDVVACTGVLISSNAVLTSGICMFDFFSNRTYESATVYPSQNGDLSPFGGIKSEDVFIHPLLVSDFQQSYNFAVLILETEVGLEAGWMSVESPSYNHTFGVFLQGYAMDIGIDMQSRMCWDEVEG
eukprot:TRINITY_DN9193_c0_g1_i2.p1 TRINITY_DN9193_c0_g1~~TRINITY_DN9193_c0_g1_i2.p1  ORF type:complete len:206 (-),score=36.82 TRINITY_DN9193_c0_g1_i2:400-1017(-)